MDKYGIDSHKLFYHVPRVNRWLNGENIYPIYMEISPSGHCNHRCTFCALDYMEYQKRSLETGILKKRLQELGSLGLKSVMFAGEGEPLLHRDFEDMVIHARSSGIDVAITTNGVLLKPALSEHIISHVEWIKISISGGTSETYAKIHRTKPSDFNGVIKNISYAAELKQKNGYTCALGMQILLLPENRHEILLLARIARDIGLDYLVVKPYSQHLLSRTDRYKDIRYSDYKDLSEALCQISGNGFNTIFRMNTMRNWDEGTRCYGKCLALPFWSYLDAGGNVWGCSAYLGDDRFHYGNIYEQSFEEIWEGEKRAASMEWVDKELDTTDCRVNCRMDQINRYLWDLTHPPEHVNFI